MIRPPPKSPLFPTTPLFQSQRPRDVPERFARPAGADDDDASVAHDPPRDGLVDADALHLVEQELERVAADEAHLDDHALRSEEHTSELQSQSNLVCRLLLEK